MINQPNNKVFISYSHKDETIARKIAEKLLDLGADIFFAYFDIQPGDSLIDKIFNEGLKEAKAFLIILSNDSVNSNWVKEELNYATISRIENKIKIIPILIEKVDIPSPLKTLLWVDLQDQQTFNDKIKKIFNSITGISDRPKTVAETAYTRNMPSYDGNLSKIAAEFANKILRSIDHDSAQTFWFNKNHIKEMMPELSIDEINEIAEELEEYGLVKLIKYIGTGPYIFGEIIPTYMLQLEFKKQLNFDPNEDIKIVAASIASLKSTEGKKLEEATKLSVGRLNRAVDYLNDYGIVDARKYMGSAPYNFGVVTATRKTKEYLSHNS